MSELDRLRAENAALNDQVKLLAKTEQRLFRLQRDADRQLVRVQAFADLALAASIGDTEDTVIERTVAFLKRLFYVDCSLVLRPAPGEGAALVWGAVAGKPCVALPEPMQDWLHGQDPVELLDLSITQGHAGLTSLMQFSRQLGLPGDPDPSTYLAALSTQCRQGFVAVYLWKSTALRRSILSQPLTPAHAPFLRLVIEYLRRSLDNFALTQALAEHGAELARTNLHLSESLRSLEESREEVARSEETLRTILEASPLPILWANAAGRVEFLNGKARELFESGPEGAITDCFTASDESTKSAVVDRWEAAVRQARDSGGELVPAEYQLLARDGSARTVEVFGAVHRERIIAIFNDVTERKRAEEEKTRLQEQLVQSQKMESVGRLAGGVAHDFNNMLGVIMGHGEMALRHVPSDSPIQLNLAEIQKAAQRSADLTRQLLAFARRQTVAPKVLDLNETIASMLKMLRRLIGEAIQLVWKPGPRLWAVKVDPSQVDQVLANLCVNARDAIADVGLITIHTENVAIDEAYCSGKLDPVPGDYVRLVVSDTGCGITKDALPHIFEPFYTTKRVGEGTGLGLATVYGAVRQNGGFLNVYSEPGIGTTFTIYLPRDTSTISDHDADSSPAPIEQGHETVLLVEDEPAMLDMSRRILESLGYSVLAANSPTEAVRLAHQHAGELDLLLTDVVMPEMNGRDLVALLLSSQPRLKYLFMSGYTADVISHHGVLDSGEHFIQKPFSMRDLAAKLRETLADR